MTLNGYTRSVDVPDGLTDQVVEAVAAARNYQATLPNPVPRPAPGEEGDWEPTIPNPQNKTDFAIGVAREYLMSFLSQASIQAAQQAAREAAVVANQAVLDSVVTVEVAP